MKDIHIKIPDKEHAQLSDYCKAQERTISDVLREQIRLILKQWESIPKK